MIEMLAKNIYIQNLIIFVYVIVLYYLLLWYKNLKPRDILTIAGLTSLVVLPYTIYVQYYFYFNYITEIGNGPIFLAPFEEFTKLIPVIYIIDRKRAKNLSVSDFVYAGIISGECFNIFEDLFYQRGEEQLNLFCGSLDNLSYASLEVNFSHIVSTGLIALCIGLAVKTNGGLLKRLPFILLSIFSLCYFTFEHGFYNAAIQESLFGIIDYPDNETAVFIHDFLGKNKFSHIILFTSSILISAIEAIKRYRFKKDTKVQDSNVQSLSK